MTTYLAKSSLLLSSTCPKFNLPVTTRRNASSRRSEVEPQVGSASLPSIDMHQRWFIAGAAERSTAMAWQALVHTSNPECKTYLSLTLRSEGTQEPDCFLRLYDGDNAVAETLASIPQLAMAVALQFARTYLKHSSITEENLRWMRS